MKPPDRAALAVLLIAVVILSLAGAFVWLHITSTSDGARLQPGARVWQRDGVVVTPLEEQPNGLRAGDVVIAVDGQSIEAWARALLNPSAPRPNWRFGETVVYTVVRDGRTLDLNVTLGSYPLGAILANDWGTILFALISQLVATFVFLRRSDDRAARVLFLWASSILSATTWSLGLQVSDLVGGIGFWLFKATAFGAYMLFWIAGLHFALVFPQPHPILWKFPWIIRSIYVAPYALYPAYLAAAWPGASSTLDWFGRWSLGETALAFVYLALVIVTGISGYRASRDMVTRQKIRWVVFAGLVSGGGGLALWLLPDIILGHKIISANVLGLLVLPFPLAITVAIMRHHLFDIDIILNRTLVYGALTASTMGLYIFIVWYVGNLFQAVDRSAIAFLTTGLVAIIFQPLRERLQRAVNRLMYGERDEPYAVLSRLGQRLEATLAPDAVLPAIVETVAQALKLPYAAIALTTTDDRPPTADGESPAVSGQRSAVVVSRGKPTKDLLEIPLVYQGETIGQLILAPRAPGEPFSLADRRLLEDIAHQAGVAVHAVRLTADLQRSREQLVTTREEERRRLRRDLHDGLGPALASLTLKLDAARNLLPRDPAATDTLLADLKSQTQAAIADIRRLVYNLRPPALDALGLVSAIREHAQQYDTVNGLRVRVEGPEQLPPLPAAVEVAAYRITLEALTNVVHHARAHNCVIRFSLDDALRVEIHDDGIGFAPQARVGVGLTSMRERAAELEGTFSVESPSREGTRISATLPLPKN